MKLTDFVAGGSTAASGLATASTSLNAGEAISQGDLVVQAADTNAYWANDPSSYFAAWRPLFQSSTLYSVPVAANTAFQGSSIGGAAALNSKTTAVLTNGNIVVASCGPSYALVSVMILTPTGTVVLPQTTVVGSTSVTNLSVCALTGGGFAVAWSGGSGYVGIYTFNSAGGVTGSFAPPAAAGYTAAFSIAALSNGNLVYTWGGNTSSNAQAYWGILSSTASVVVAATAIGPNSNYGSATVAALSGGGFVIHYPSTATQSAYAIYSNAGAVVLAQTNALAMTAGTPPYVAAFSGGGFALCAISTATNVATFNAAGVQQGSTISLSVSASGFIAIPSPIDGSLLLGFLASSGPYSICIARISAAGALVSSTSSLTQTSGLSIGWNMALTPDNGLVVVSTPSGTTGSLTYLNSSLVAQYPTSAASTVTSAGANVSISTNGPIGCVAGANTAYVAGCPYVLVCGSGGINLYAIRVQQCAAIGVSSGAFAQGQSATVQILGAAATRLTFAKPFLSGGIRGVGNTAMIGQPVQRNIN